MQKWGRTAAGKQRFRCAQCGKSGIRRRPDNQRRLWQCRFIHWLIHNTSLHLLARQYRVSERTLRRKFVACWRSHPRSHPPDAADLIPIVILDGTGVVKRHAVVLIAQNPARSVPIGWQFAEREKFETWVAFLTKLRLWGVAPSFVVCDGQRGLLAAIRLVWPQTLIQRCIIHVNRQVRIWLTQRPKTPAGKKLLLLMRTLMQVRTRRQKRRWMRTFRKWCKKHEAFLKERTHHPTEPKRWWYTHRKLRATRSLIKNSIPDLFRFVSNPEIPRTSNHVEGGVNSRLKELLRSHRGVSAQKKLIITSSYLAHRQRQKPTQTVH